MAQTVNTSRLADGSGATATFSGTAVPSIKTIAVSMHGSKEKIDLTTLSNTAVTTSVLSKLSEIEDVVIGSGFVPNTTFITTSAALVITVPTYSGSTLTLTLYCQFGGASTSDVAAKAASDVDYTFVVTNLNAGVETAPAVT